jgi:peptidoglycan/xylan/chitin deacetylase (PgdA/CDA1 family)
LNSLPILASGAVAATAGITSWAAVAASSQLFGPTLRHTRSSKQIALTFDDGPNPAVTPHLLELLDRYSVRATFFLIGKYVRDCPGLVQEISMRGHLIGNHTDTHPNLFFHSRSQIRDELLRCQGAIDDAMAGQPRWMRPPYGYRNPLLDAEVTRAGIQGVVMWSKIFGDWKVQPPGRLIERLARVGSTAAGHGDILLLHDGDHRVQGADRNHVVAALEHWLPRWRDAGFEFVTIDSCEVKVKDAKQDGLIRTD